MADITSAQNVTGLLSTATNLYMTQFEKYSTLFISWGKEVFLSLFAINITWMAMWYAFDKDSLVASLSEFLKRYVIAMIFYYLMVNPNVLASIINTAMDMGVSVVNSGSSSKITGVDPSSVIGQGFSIGNKLLTVVNSSSFLTNFFGALEVLVVYVIVVFCFMTVGLQIAVTQIIATALAMFACLSLSFSALGATTSIARKTIDALIGSSFKLLGYYLVIGTASATFSSLEKQFPSGFQDMTPYGWLCACVLLMWLLSKSLPNAFETIGGGIIGDIKGAEAASLAMTAINTAKAGLTAGKALFSKDAKDTPPQSIAFNFYGSSGPGTSPSGGGGGNNNGGAASMKNSVPGNTTNDSHRTSGKSGSSGGANSGAVSSDSNKGHMSDSANQPNAGRKNVINFKERAAQKSGADNKRTYPDMSQDGKQYKTGQ
ncbi:MAG: type IV secretion system protein [Gammaproteobacteria bacterium]|nr:type IV secretion system protein [Gammaproteobacteria bacterium]